MKALLVVLLCSASCLGAMYGQHIAGEAKGRILSSRTNDRDTIDFGYSMAGNDSAYVYRSIYFVNDGSEALVVRDTDIVLENISPTASKSDFFVPARFPLHLSTANTINNPFVYDSIRCFSTTFLNDAPEGLNQVKMPVRLAFERTGSSDSIVARRDFVLRFIKTVRPVWAQSIINFDSIYVGASRTDTIFLRNTDLKRTVRIEDTSLVVFSGALSAYALRDNPLKTLVRDSGQSAVALRIQYTSKQRGLDSAHYRFAHFNPSKLKDASDETPVILRGVGIEQRVELSQVNAPRASLRGDTVDLGSFTVGIQDTVRLVFQNQGNLSYRANMSMLALSPSDTIPYSVLDSLSTEHKYVPPASVDSMTVVFHPTRVGTFVTRCVLHSNIASRVFGVPDSVIDKVFYLKAESRPRRITSLSPALSFDSVVVFDQCAAARTLNLRLFNTTNQSISVDAPTVQPADAPFVVDPPVLGIPAGSEGLFQVHFTPRSVKDFSAQIVIQSAADDFPIQVAASGRGVGPREMNLRIPEETRSFPGHFVSIPLIVDPSLSVLAQSFRAVLSYDSSLLRYDHYDKVGTASAAAVGTQLVIDSHVADRITLKIQMPEVFSARDTLLRLVFQSSLGFADRCDISVSEPAFGLGNCLRVMPSTSPQGSFVLDSLCGLQSKLPLGPLASFVLGLPSPNPAPHSTQISYTVAFPTRVRIEILNSIGNVVDVVVNETQEKGVYTINHSLDALGEGVYYLRMNAGIYQAVEHLVISR